MWHLHDVWGHARLRGRVFRWSNTRYLGNAIALIGKHGKMSAKPLSMPRVLQSPVNRTVWGCTMRTVMPAVRMRALSASGIRILSSQPRRYQGFVTRRSRSASSSSSNCALMPRYRCKAAKECIHSAELLTNACYWYVPTDELELQTGAHELSAEQTL